MACEILVPQPGIEPTFLASGGRFLTTGPTREVPEFLIIDSYLKFFFFFNNILLAQESTAWV